MKPFLSKSPSQTEHFAATFSRRLKKGEIIALCGDLGSGKTTFVRGLFQGMHGNPEYFVTSPTFTLLHEYTTKKGPLYHFDLYRIETFAEFQQIDFEEYFGGGGSATGNGICVVEWGDKIPELASEFDYKISFKIADGNEREICVQKSPLAPLFQRGGI